MPSTIIRENQKATPNQEPQHKLATTHMPNHQHTIFINVLSLLLRLATIMKMKPKVSLRKSLLNLKLQLNLPSNRSNLKMKKMLQALNQLKLNKLQLQPKLQPQFQPKLHPKPKLQLKLQLQLPMPQFRHRLQSRTHYSRSLKSSLTMLKTQRNIFLKLRLKLLLQFRPHQQQQPHNKPRSLLTVSQLPSKSSKE